MDGNLSQYVLETLLVDQEFVLYRAEHSSERGLPSVLVLAPASEHPSLVTLKKIEHEYSLRHELDSAWAVRPLALSEQGGQTMLTLEDPGGDTLEKSLSGPMETAQLLRVAVALSGLHGRRPIHKDVKPALGRLKVLVDRYPLNAAKQAYDDFEHGRLVGRAVLMPAPQKARAADAQQSTRHASRR